MKASFGNEDMQLYSGIEIICIHFVFDVSKIDRSESHLRLHTTEELR